MKQVLAVRVGAKKAGWWPTVPVAFSEARFQVKKSACFGAVEDIRNDKYLVRS